MTGELTIAEFNRDKDEAEIQRVFDELLRLHDSLDSEEKRYISEGFDSEVQLAVFDLLSKDKNAFHKTDVANLKAVAKELVATIENAKVQMAELRDKASAQARMKSAIVNQLLNGLPDGFSNDEIDLRADSVFRYLQEQRGASPLH